MEYKTNECARVILYSEILGLWIYDVLLVFLLNKRTTGTVISVHYINIGQYWSIKYLDMDKVDQEFHQYKSDTTIVLEQSRNVLYGSGETSNLESGYEPGVGLREGEPPHVNTHSVSDWGIVSDVVNSNHAQSTPRDSNGADNNGIPQWAIDMRRQLENIQTTLNTQNTRWSTVEKQLEGQNVRMTNIEIQISQISNIKKKTDSNEIKLTNMNTEIGEMQGKVQEYDRSIHYYSQVCDDLIQSNTGLKENIDELSSKVNYMLQKQADINIKQTNTDEQIIDMQWRSMRENLIFTGLAEPRDPSRVNYSCENIVKDFIRTELNIEQDISLDRAHRMGRYSMNQRFPRPIVAKFTYYKDKELVRTTASRCLAGSRFRVKEHYPAEIEARRKLLYGEANAARQNPNNKVRLVRDKLYINGQQYEPGLSDYQNSRNKDTQQRNAIGTNNQSTFNSNEHRVRFDGNVNDIQRGRGRSRGRGRGRGSYVNIRNQPQQSTPQSRKIVTAERRISSNDQRDTFSEANAQGDTDDFSYGANIPTTNKYSWLGEDRGGWSDDEIANEPHNRQSSLAGKNKLSSPLDSSPKRQREYTSDISRNSDNMDYEQSCEYTASGKGRNSDTSNSNTEESTRL